MKKRKRRPWSWVVDNSIDCYGDIDGRTRTIRINVKLHAAHNELLLDTLLHEDLHRLYPKKTERQICALTKRVLPTLTVSQRLELYDNLFGHRRYKQADQSIMEE